MMRSKAEYDLAKEEIAFATHALEAAATHLLPPVQEIVRKALLEFINRTKADMLEFEIKMKKLPLLRGSYDIKDKS